MVALTEMQISLGHKPIENNTFEEFKFSILEYKSKPSPDAQQHNLFERYNIRK